MSFLTIKNVEIAGLSACVPPDIEENSALPIFETEEEAKKVVLSTGIERKRIVREGTTSSDLAVPAIETILESLGWSKDSIDCLVYVSQTRDFIAPITSAIIQGRIGLRNDCFCIDLPMGCSGWVYGLSNICSLLSHGDLKRGLLVCAETSSTNRSKRDKTVRPLFGDAATVTALEFNENAPAIYFDFGVDGKGFKAVWAEFGGSRNPVTPESLVEKEIEPGVWRKGTDMTVNGMDVFSFAIKEPPKSLQRLMEKLAIDVEDVDYLWLHQANHYINDRIRRKLKLPEGKVLFSLNDFGNTSSSSIPLTMIACCSLEDLAEPKKHMACGFGVGLSWGSVFFETQRIKCLNLSNYNY